MEIINVALIFGFGVVSGGISTIVLCLFLNNAHRRETIEKWEKDNAAFTVR